MDITETIEKLRKWREECRRNPDEIRDLWPRLNEIQRHLEYEERWTVIEQFAMAAIDLHDEAMFNVCFGWLLEKFPDSNRVRLLDIMASYERKGDYDGANKLYNKILKEDPTNTVARKRKISILISQHNYVEAIKELCEYLRKFMNDQEAWKELCDLYLLEQDFPKAIFCMEELLLGNATDHIYHTRLAEIHFAHGTHESLELARSYYCQALRLNPENTKALLGLHLTLSQNLKSNKLNIQQRKEQEKLLSWCKNNIKNLYEKEGHPNTIQAIKDSFGKVIKCE